MKKPRICRRGRHNSPPLCSSESGFWPGLPAAFFRHLMSNLEVKELSVTTVSKWTRKSLCGNFLSPPRENSPRVHATTVLRTRNHDYVATAWQRGTRGQRVGFFMRNPYGTKKCCSSTFRISPKVMGLGITSTPYTLCVLHDVVAIAVVLNDSKGVEQPFRWRESGNQSTHNFSTRISRAHLKLLEFGLISLFHRVFWKRLCLIKIIKANGGTLLTDFRALKGKRVLTLSP